MYILNINSDKKDMTIKELRDLIREKYYKQVSFPKENSFYSMKRQKKNLLSFATKSTEKTPDPSHEKEYYQFYLKKKNQKNCESIKNYCLNAKDCRKLKLCKRNPLLCRQPFIK